MSKIKITSIQNWLLVLAFIAMFEPDALNKLVIIHRLCQGITILTFAWLLCECLYSHHGFDRILGITFVYGLIMIFSSITNGNLEISTIRIILAIINIVLCFEKYAFDRVRWALLYAFGLLILINLMFSCIQPGSLAYVNQISGWFLTGSNALIIYCLPACCISIASIEMGKQKLLAIAIIVMSFITVLLSETATSLFAIFILIMLWLVQKFFKFTVLNIKSTVTIIVLVFIICVVLQVQDKISIINYIIVDILQRDISFTSRTFIWRESIRLIMQSPVIGYGFSYGFHVVVGSVGFWADHAHDHYLQQFIQGGVIQFALFICIIIEMIKKMRKLSLQTIYWAICSVFVIGIVYLFESYTNPMIYSVFYLIYYNCKNTMSIKNHVKPTIGCK